MTPVEALTAELTAIDYALRMKREGIDRLTDRRRKVTEMLRQYESEGVAQIDENYNATINE